MRGVSEFCVGLPSPPSSIIHFPHFYLFPFNQVLSYEGRPVLHLAYQYISGPTALTVRYSSLFSFAGTWGPYVLPVPDLPPVLYVSSPCLSHLAGPAPTPHGWGIRPPSPLSCLWSKWCHRLPPPSTPARLLSSLGNAGAAAPLPCLTAVTQRAALHDRLLRKWGLEHLLVGALTAVTPVPCASTADVAGPHVCHRWTVDSVLPPVETLVL